MVFKQKPETTHENADITAVSPLNSIDCRNASTTVSTNEDLGRDISTSPANEDDTSHSTGIKFALLLSFMFVGMFLISLEMLIISTAIPQITNDFIPPVTLAVFEKIYAFFSIKSTFMASILLFEVGSALCGTALDSITFIAGRAVAGLGAGGVMSGASTHSPSTNAPNFFGAVFGLCSISGSLIGGGFTTGVSWHWYFHLNLPAGVLVLLLVPFLLDIPDRPKTNGPWKKKLRQLDALGMIALLPGVVCLCLALQWGETTYVWSEGRIFALLTLSFALLIAFVLIQIQKPD
ncbi:major facilitator superfamily domain-containing protein [Rhexocercosporidium sp. MPI-PUGE-AT-0058]|nr:major facilitator superfamily domain-containing protein [Rhexocercosporidium sp. MPI-PUGE-AT-0058]